MGQIVRSAEESHATVQYCLDIELPSIRSRAAIIKSRKACLRPFANDVIPFAPDYLTSPPWPPFGL
jgi:hypothetical protein